MTRKRRAERSDLSLRTMEGWELSGGTVSGLIYRFGDLETARAVWEANERALMARVWRGRRPMAWWLFSADVPDRLRDRPPRGDCLSLKREPLDIDAVADYEKTKRARACVDQERLVFLAEQDLLESDEIEQLRHQAGRGDKAAAAALEVLDGA